MKPLVFGATGNVGGRVTRRLIELGVRPAVFVRDPERARALFGDRVDIHVGEFGAPALSLSEPLTGIDRIFLVTDGPSLDQYDRAVALSAREAGVGHIVKLSTLDVLTGVGTGPWHARGEQAIRESGVGFTFVQAAGFMSNALGWTRSIRNEGVLRSSTGEGKIAFIHPDDIAAVAVAALTTGDYDGASLVITGPEALRYGEMAAMIGRAIGKAIGFETISDEDARRRTIAWAGEGPYAEAIVDIWRAVRRGKLDMVTEEVEAILGRKPTPFRRWVAENVASFQ